MKGANLGLNSDSAIVDDVRELVGLDKRMAAQSCRCADGMSRGGAEKPTVDGGLQDLGCCATVPTEPHDPAWRLRIRQDRQTNCSVPRTSRESAAAFWSGESGPLQPCDSTTVLCHG